MNSEWREFKVGELCTVTSSKRIFAHDYVDDGVPFYASKDIIDKALGSFSGPTVYISKDRFFEVAKKFGYPLCGDLLLSSVGNRAGIPYVVKNEGEFYFKDGNITWFKDFSSLNSMFLCYWLKSEIGQFALNSIMIGSAQKALTISGLLGLKIKVPSLQAQEKIVSILKSLDDRITLLCETNATLEAIAKTLFKSWFVDFDPVRAKSERIELECMDSTTAGLFPDSFEESELGLVPRGWKVVPFTETIDVIGGGTPKTVIEDYWNGDIPWFSVVDAPTTTDVFVIDTEKHITVAGLNNSSTKLLRAGTTIISARGTVGRLALVGRDMAMNQSCYGLCGKAGDTYFTYFKTYHLVESLKQRAHGSVFDTITRDTLAGVSIAYPDERIICKFESALSPFMERLKENLKQVKTLAQLRDTLLSRLISGQMRLPETEAESI